MLACFLAMCVMMRGDVEDAERLIAQNESLLPSIRTLRATIEVKQSNDEGKTWKTLQTTRVIRSGQRELIRSKYAGAFVHGVWRPNESEQSELFDPSQTLTLTASPKVGAGINRPPATGPGGWLNQWKAQTLMTNGIETYRGLVDRCRLAQVLPEVGEDGKAKTLVLIPKTQEDVKAYRVTFSPARAGLVMRVDMDFVDPDKSESSKVRSARREVIDVHDLGQGIFLPKTIRVTRYDEPSTINLFEIGDVECNQPISDSEFALPIPEGTVVVDHRVGKYHLWGTDGPARTFASPADFRDWTIQQRENPSPPKSAWTTIAAIVAGSSVLLIVILLAYRRRLGRHV